MAKAKLVGYKTRRKQVNEWGTMVPVIGHMLKIRVNDGREFKVDIAICDLCGEEVDTSVYGQPLDHYFEKHKMQCIYEDDGLIGPCIRVNVNGVS